jgi:SPP1 family predicted phage head-tail adaptor
MQAGDLPHRVTLEQVTEVSDGHDGLTQSWSTAIFRMPARVRPLQGRDLERARQIDPRITHEVALRYWRDYPSDLDGGRTRLVYHDISDRTFEIVGPPVDEEERHIRLVVPCKEAA